MEQNSGTPQGENKWEPSTFLALESKYEENRAAPVCKGASIEHPEASKTLLTSKMPRLAAGGADGSVRAGKPQCCGQTHISATGIFQRKGLYTHQWSLFNSQTQTSGFSYFCGKTMAPQTFQMLLTNITYVCVCELSYEL